LNQRSWEAQGKIGVLAENLALGNLAHLSWIINTNLDGRNYGAVFDA
jgi:hypothetical protein